MIGKLVLLGQQTERSSGSWVVFESLKQNHEILWIVAMIQELQFFPHAAHAFVVDDYDVEVADYLRHELLVINALHYLRTNAPTKLVPLLNDRELSQNLFRMVFAALRVAFQQQEQHLLNQQFEVLLSHSRVLDY